MIPIDPALWVNPAQFIAKIQSPPSGHLIKISQQRECSTDVSMAIRTVLESFIQTQKYSVMRQMQRNFNRYLTYKKDNHQLLLYLLKQCVSERLHVQAHRVGLSVDRLDEVFVHEKDLTDKARQLNIYNLQSFYKSELFAQNRFKFDSKKKLIAQQRDDEDNVVIRMQQQRKFAKTEETSRNTISGPNWISAHEGVDVNSVVTYFP
uniref:DNA replication licensing factor MCM2-like winged-helix domain-containing protein n=1 Tax=Romanomermis culicivorax TaxID=13658 RepID=A0A915IRJ9_ROMCU